MITTTEIAKLTGVSQATVSRVLNGNTAVNEKIREKVLACAKENHYQPNVLARGLTGNRTKLLGVVVSDICNPFFSELVKSIETYAKETGYSLMLFNTDYEEKKEEEYLDILSRYHVDGILIVPISEEKRQADKYKKYKIPMVAVTRKLEGLDSVFVSHEGAGGKAANHLLENGYERFIFLGEKEDEKEAGFRKELEKQGVDLKKNYNHIIRNRLTQFVYQDREAFAEELRGCFNEDKNTGTGIFASNDTQAVRALEALKEMGISVPDQAAVIGFDNTYLAKIVSPALTSVSQPVGELARLGIERLIERIEGKAADAVHYQLDTRIVTRQSTVKMKLV